MVLLASRFILIYSTFLFVLLK